MIPILVLITVLTAFAEELLDRLQVLNWITEDHYPPGVTLSQETLEHIKKQLNLDKIPPQVKPLYGFILHRTDMKLYPTELKVYRKDPHIDYNQYTTLEAFTPVKILHTSYDGRWYYVQTPWIRGWVKRDAVVVVPYEDWERVQTLPFLVVLKDDVLIGGTAFGIGSRVPYEEKTEDSYLVLLPDGRKLWIRKNKFLHEGFLKFSQDDIRARLEALLGRPYVWGGRYDCSALVQNLYAIYGIELPRNSAQQSKTEGSVEIRFETYQAFKNFLQRLPPFQTLLFMKGHVMIYGGIEDGDVVVYHALYGIKRDDGTEYYPRSVVKNLLQRDRLTNLYRRVTAVLVLPSSQNGGGGIRTPGGP